MAICNNCGRKYNRFLTPVSAKGVCSECFFAQLEAEASAVDPHPTEERASGRESQVGTPVDTPPQRAPAVPAMSVYDQLVRYRERGQQTGMAAIILLAVVAFFFAAYPFFWFGAIAFLIALARWFALGLSCPRCRQVVYAPPFRPLPCVCRRCQLDFTTVEAKQSI